MSESAQGDVNCENSLSNKDVVAVVAEEVLLTVVSHTKSESYDSL